MEKLLNIKLTSDTDSLEDKMLLNRVLGFACGLLFIEQNMDIVNCMITTIDEIHIFKDELVVVSNIPIWEDEKDAFIKAWNNIKGLNSSDQNVTFTAKSTWDDYYA